MDGTDRLNTGEYCIIIPGMETLVPIRQMWILIDPDNQPYASNRPGAFGGHRRTRIYGRLDCPAALRAIARGGYVAHRVFFLTEEHARAAGYRPCAVCMPAAYAAWQRARAGEEDRANPNPVPGTAQDYPAAHATPAPSRERRAE